MGNKNALRKQQNISQASRRSVGASGAEPGLARLLDLTVNFGGTLDKCSARAGVGSVHRVRTGSRRIQAAVEMLLREGGPRAGSLEEPAQQWLSGLKRLRRKASRVRDLDVHRKLLKKPLADSMERPPAEEEKDQAAGNQLRGLTAQLDDWLKDHRRARAEALKKYLGKHGPKLGERKSVFLAAADRVGVPRAKASRAAEAAALQDFARLSAAMPVLDAENLHDFRKSVKKARYIAESGASERGSKKVFKSLQRMQDVIGDWHDWLCLTQEAQTALGDDGAELIARLTVETSRHFTRALAATGRMREELLDAWRAVENQTRERPSGRGPGRKPVSRVAAAVSARSA
jgi:CHAD domain-containing protein